jgi:RNA 2',3'-cyclic 3'-phosphodiesterase
MIPHPIRDVSLRQEALWNDGPHPSAVSDEAFSHHSDTLFFGLRPPSDIAARAHRSGDDVRNAHGLRCPLIGRERLHLSLLGFDSPRILPEEAVDALRCVGATVVMPQFRIELNRMMSFGKKSDRARKRAFVLAGDDETTPGIAMLRRQIICALRLAGCRATIPVSFNPHMTLFWDRHDPGEQPIEELGWTARDFVLIHSLHGLGKHEELGRWPLRASV